MRIADVAYLADGREERLDLYLPDAPGGGARPAVVIIHGGGWRIGDKADARELQTAQTLVEAGFVCASVNYLLSTDARVSWPTCLEDCREAVRYLRRNATKHNIDPARIGAIGGSAGGCLSLLLGKPDEAEVSSRVQAIVALYPPTDMLTWGDRVRLFGASKQDRPDLHRAGSPLHQLTPDFPPTLLMHGTSDAIVPLEQSQKLAAAMAQMGLDHELIVFEGLPHTFKLKDNGVDVREKVVSFFARHLKRAPLSAT